MAKGTNEEFFKPTTNQIQNFNQDYYEAIEDFENHSRDLDQEFEEETFVYSYITARMYVVGFES